MPITTAFNSANYHSAVWEILRQHLLDYLPTSDHVITSEQPSTENMRKAIVYVFPIDALNLDRLRTRRGSKSLQRKELSFGVILITSPGLPASVIPNGPGNKVRQMAAVIEQQAVLRDGYKLADAGLRTARITPFIDLNPVSEQLLFRKLATLSLVVYVEAS